MITNPLDVINTRVKAAQAPATASTGAGEAEAGATVAARSEVRISSIARNLVKNEGYGALLSGLGPRLLILGFGSGLFWGAYGFAKTSWFRVALAADRQMWQGEDEGSSSRR